MTRLAALRKEMQAQKIDYYLVPRTDEFQSEYLAPYAERLAYLTNFTGSYGFAIIGMEKAALFTDARYDLQILSQVDQAQFECHLISDVKPEKWLSDQDIIIGYEPDLFTHDHLKKFESDMVKLKALPHNLIDKIWADQPAPPQGVQIKFDPEAAGKNSDDKIADLCAEMKANEVTQLVITRPDSVCWLLNIRGKDIPFNPLVLSYLLLSDAGEYRFYSFHENDPDHAEILQDIQALKTPQKFWIDPASTPLHIVKQIEDAGHDMHAERDPVMLQKACKNEVELAGMRDAHIQDGISLCLFYMWLDLHHDPYVLTELDLVAQLLEFRKLHASFVQDSFSTIAGAGANGAIVHYSADHRSNRLLKPDELILVDSGGQYEYGTTDITRVFIKGVPSDQMIKDYTLVLKGHIALSRAIFPQGTKGVQLDSFARQYLWQAKCDFAHGTGHGVGHFACVHEGPQSISPAYVNQALKPGMVLSNEPGLYRKNEYGIRLENLIIVNEQGTGLDDKPYYGFENLTLVPFERDLIDASLLSQDELTWLNDYHEKVRATLLNNIDNCHPEFESWLVEKTMKIA